MMRDCTPLPGMIGCHPSMLAVYALVRRAAPTDLPVAVVGQTGTGKELVARAVHDLSGVAGAFVDINCAAIPENLVEAELFGWEQGAYTGAHRTTPGLLELADHGTLFLDEACSLPRLVQAKLLRAIEQGQHRRVGGRKSVSTRFRLVLALTRSPEELVEQGLFLAAFAHRVSGITTDLPPLARRGADVSRLAEVFLAEAAAKSGRPLVWSREAIQQLQRLPWPGNVRELRSLVARMPVHVDSGIVTASDVVVSAARQSPQRLSRAALQRALDRHRGNYSRAALELGLARTTLRDRVLRVPPD